jgi:hypothetical protein
VGLVQDLADCQPQPHVYNVFSQRPRPTRMNNGQLFQSKTLILFDMPTSKRRGGHASTIIGGQSTEIYGNVNIQNQTGDTRGIASSTLLYNSLLLLDSELGNSRTRPTVRAMSLERELEPFSSRDCKLSGLFLRHTSDGNTI